MQELAGESLALNVTTATPDRNWFAKKDGNKEPILEIGSVADPGQEDYPMEVVEQEKKPPLILGRRATSTLLNERGCGAHSSPKRQLPALPGTPLKRSRVSGLITESASPTLKKNQGPSKKDERNSANVRRRSMLKPKLTSANSNKSTRRKGLETNQPLIDTLFKKVDGVVGEQIQEEDRERDGENELDQA